MEAGVARLFHQTSLFFLTQLDVSTSHQRVVIRLHHHWNLNFLSPHNYLAKQQNLSQPLCLPDQKLS